MADLLMDYMTEDGARRAARPRRSDSGALASARRKVLIATLWQRTSGKGNTYLSGFLGKARVVGFKGAPTADGTPTWDLYVQPGKEQEVRGGRGQRESRSPTSSSRTGVQRWAIRKACTFILFEHYDVNTKGHRLTGQTDMFVEA